MYFDDASRHHINIPWNPDDGMPSPNRSEEKHDAVKRILLGYNAESASLLSEDEGTCSSFFVHLFRFNYLEIMLLVFFLSHSCLYIPYPVLRLNQSKVLRQMKLWASNAGVVGDYLGDELYRETLGTTVCNATSVVGCIAHFWQAIVAVIDEHTDDVDPTRWTMPVSTPNRTLRVLDIDNQEEKSHSAQSAEHIYFAVFPNCQDLYDYTTMFNFMTTMEFSKELCLHLGNRFSLTLFHPKFKNSPRLLSPERHSPFPCAGLQFGEPPHLANRTTATMATTTTTPTPPKIKPKKMLLVQLDLDEQRKQFEVLFNSAAASGGDEDDSIEPLSDFYGEELVDSLSKSFQHEEQLRREDLPKSTVKGMLQSWIMQNRYTDDAQRQQNRALQFIDTVADEPWIISEHEIAEKAYADIWKAISDLYIIGCRADEEYEAGLAEYRENRADGAPDKPHAFSQADWMKTLSRPLQHEVQPVIRSSVFVATKFCAFNAQSFKRFAITINAALKRLTNGQMFLEVFHPEYVGRKGYNSVMRRSPFPMIQICYEQKQKGRTTDRV